MNNPPNKIAVEFGEAPGMRGDARIYKLLPPMTVVGYDGVVDTHEFVVVSAVDVPFSGPETYIFPSNEKGDITDWGELDGSYRGGLDHAEALSNSGYEIMRAALQ